MKVTVAQLLANKGSKVWSVSPETSVYEALQLLAERDIGALLVIGGEQIAGLFSERDYARRVILRGKTSKDTPVAEIMTRPVLYVPPWRTLDECMALMTARKIRHLPVLDEGKLVGVISIGDVVKAMIAEQEFAIQELEAFVDQALKDKATQTTGA
ncbi:MAG TPA: CBS domain-containing protein [Candidatus Hydrogenedentes bacterium]|nr:CBS domain-containing protein [Candidatus Hydrogenedentota bacterium]